MSRNVQFAPGEFYHLYNRGTEKRKIFLSVKDYKRFISLLYICNGEKKVDLSEQGKNLYELETIDRGLPLIDICAYVLMPNHFHLLVREKEEGGISSFMQKFSTGYTMYFNNSQNRTGALFQGKFKATHASEDRYLKYLISYIHLNPIKLIEPTWKETGIAERTKAEHYLETYPHSSYIDYRGKKRIENSILNTHALPEYFKSPKSFKESITEWISFKEAKE